MADSTVGAYGPDGQTFLFKLYSTSGNTILNGVSGDVLTEQSANKGLYIGTVSEALTGIKTVRITNSGDQTILRYHVDLNNDTGFYPCYDIVPDFLVTETSIEDRTLPSGDYAQYSQITDVNTSIVNLSNNSSLEAF